MRLVVLSVLVVAALAFAQTTQTTANQGKPGKQGPWPVAQGVGYDGGVTWGVFDRVVALNPTGIAAGLVPGATAVNKFGRNPDIDTADVPEDLWSGNGVYTGFPMNADGGARAEPLQVFSSSAADDANDAGTGAWTVTIQGLDVNYASISETVTLDGTTPVVTAASFARTNLAFVATVGSGGANAGTITVRHATTTADVFVAMPVGYNQCQCSAYTVPAQKTAYVRGISLTMLGGSSAQLLVGLWVRYFGFPARIMRPYSMADTSVVLSEVASGLRMPEKTDFIFRVLSSATNNVSLSGALDIYLLDN